MDNNALIAAVEGSAADKGAITAAIAGRTPLIPMRAAKESLVKGDAALLRTFLRKTGGKIIPSSSSTVQVLIANGQKRGDAQVLGAALDKGVLLLTRDKGLIKKSRGVAVPF